LVKNPKKMIIYHVTGIMFSRSKFREENVSLKKQYQMDKQRKDKQVSSGLEKEAKSSKIKGPAKIFLSPRRSTLPKSR